MKLGQYKGIHARRPNIKVTEQDIEKVLKKKQKEFSLVITVDDQPARIEYQPLDDDFAKDFSEYDTLAEWKSAICENLTRRKETSAYNRLSRDILSAIIADSEIPIDDEIWQELTEELFEDFLYALEENGMTQEVYCQRSGYTIEGVRKLKENEALRSIQEQSVLHAVALEEHLTVTAEELTEELCILAEEEGEEADDFCESLGEEEVESIADSLLMNKAMDLILEHAILE
jgi:trigger factor